MSIAPATFARAFVLAPLLACGGAGALFGHPASQLARTISDRPAAPQRARAQPAGLIPHTPRVRLMTGRDAAQPAQVPPQEHTPDARQEAGVVPDTADPVDLPISLERIRRRAADDGAPVLTLPPRGDLPTFAVRIERRLPTFWDFVRPGELDTRSRGKTPPHYHAEMLSLITPRWVTPIGSIAGIDVLAIGRVFARAGQAHAEAEARREVQALVAEMERRLANQRAAEREAPERDPP
jgi:hypothetical protein